MTTMDHRTAVLRALAEGTLSVEEAEGRLALLDDAVPASPSAPIGPRGRTGRVERGRGRASIDDVIALASHGVDAAYLSGLRTAGFGHLDTAEIIRLVDHGVEIEWLAAIRDAGIEASVDDLVRLADHGVEPTDLPAFLGLHAGDVVDDRDE